MSTVKQVLLLQVSGINFVFLLNILKNLFFPCPIIFIVLIVSMNFNVESSCKVGTHMVISTTVVCSLLFLLN